MVSCLLWIQDRKFSHIHANTANSMTPNLPPQQYSPFRHSPVEKSWVTMWLSWSTWWRHQMETFSALLAICVGNSPVIGEFPAQRPVTRSFDVFFDLCPNKRLSKHSWVWWFETLLGPSWRHSNVLTPHSLTNPYQLTWSVKSCVLQGHKITRLR